VHGHSLGPVRNCRRHFIFTIIIRDTSREPIITDTYTSTSNRIIIIATMDSVACRDIQAQAQHTLSSPLPRVDWGVDFTETTPLLAAGSSTTPAHVVGWPNSFGTPTAPTPFCGEETASVSVDSVPPPMPPASDILPTPPQNAIDTQADACVTEMTPYVEPDSNLFVAGLPADVDDSSLAAAFATYGEVISAKVMLNVSNATSRGYGFVLFRRTADAAAARDALNGSTMPHNPSSNRLQVNVSKHSGANLTADSRVVYVRNVPCDVTNQQLHDFFAGFGIVERVQLRDTRNYLGDDGRNHLLFNLAVEFTSAAAARACVGGTHGKSPFTLCRMALLSKIEEPQSLRDRRLRAPGYPFKERRSRSSSTPGAPVQLPPVPLPPMPQSVTIGASMGGAGGSGGMPMILFASQPMQMMNPAGAQAALPTAYFAQPYPMFGGFSMYPTMMSASNVASCMPTSNGSMNGAENPNLCYWG
jgi:hypothetical protein